MPRSSSRSVVSSPQAKQQKRGSVGKSSASKSPAAKTTAPSPSPAGRSRRSTTQQSAPSSATKKTQSPSPRPKKNAASPKKTAERGRSTSRAKAKVEETVSTKGKSAPRSPSKSKTPKSKSVAASSPANVLKQAKSPKKSPGQSSKSTKTKSPAKTPKSPAKSGQRSKSKSSGDTVTPKSKGKKSPAKAQSPAKSKSPKTPRSKGKKSSAKQTADEANVEPVAVDSSELHGSTVNAEGMEVENSGISCTTTSDKKRKHEQIDDEGANEVTQEPEAKIQKTADQNGETKAEKVSDTGVAAECKNTTVTTEISNADNDKPIDELTGDDINGVAKTDYENDYEVISKEDVPAADSDEVIRAAEKMVPLPKPELDISDLQDSSPSAANVDGHNDSDSDVLFSRKFLTSSAIDVSTASASKVFNIVSYNILADVHAQKDFSGDRAPWISDSQLAISYRHQRLMKELQYLDADIVCLQEVGGDYFTELLVPSMEALGYKGLFIPRNTTSYCEGEATFYRTSSFSIVASKEMKLSEIINEEVDASSLESELKDGVKEALQTHGVAIIVRLKSRATGDEIAVANIHVTYDNLIRPDRRCIQLAMALRKLVEMADGGVKPYIICGDFNSWPESAPYQFVKNGQLNDDTFEELQAVDDAVKLQDGQTAPVVNIWTEGFYFPVVGDLKSSYAVVTGSEPLTSRFAFDGGLRAVDYIWYSSANLQPIGVLEVVKPQLIEPGVPNAVFPSDHMSLKAKFAFA